MGLDEEARTDTVEMLRGYSPHDDDDPMSWGEKAYRDDILVLAITVAVIGAGLLLLHHVYRCVLCCRACCCKKHCCSCVETCTKGKATRHRVFLLVSLLALGCSVASYSSGEAELQDAVTHTGDSLETLGDLLEHLMDITKDMAESTGQISRAVGTVTCSGNELDVFVADVADVNATVAEVEDIFDTMIGPVDDAERVVRSQGRRYVAIVVPALAIAPFSLYFLLTCLGLAFSKCSKGCAKTCLNLGSAFAGGVGLPAALAIFGVLFVVSIVIADFCYLGPSAVLLGEGENNKYLAYYLNCEGPNPLSVDVSAMDDAVDALDDYAQELEALGVCTGLTPALETIDDALVDLKGSVTEITEEVLSCDYISPIVTKVVYDGLCDSLVEGLYRVWAVVVAAGFVTYFALLLVPFTIAAFDQEGKVAPTDPPPPKEAVPIFEEPVGGVYPEGVPIQKAEYVAPGPAPGPQGELP